MTRPPALPTEVLVEILVYAAASDDIDNAQRLALSRTCRAGHLAIHRHVLLPRVELHSAAQVHAFARALRQSRDLEHLARQVTRALRIRVGPGARQLSGQPPPPPPPGQTQEVAPVPAQGDALYGPVQQQADVENNLTTPLRAILATCARLEHLSMDLTPAPLDYRLSRTAVLSAKSGKPDALVQQVWTWSRAAVSHRAHVQRRTKDPLAEFRSNVQELVCMQNVLGAGDLVDQLNIDTCPPPALGRWDRLESLQLLGPRFRLTCASAKTLALGLPALKRLALVMPNIMPPTTSGNGEDEDGGDGDPEELGRDLFLRMSPLQLLIDYLCPTDAALAKGKQVSSKRFEHLLLVGHDLTTYVGSTAKLRGWIEGLQHRLQLPPREETRYYVDPDERFTDLTAAELNVEQPRIQLITARVRQGGAQQGGPHPSVFARWMLQRTESGTNWSFGPDHPSRMVNLCLRAPVSLNDVADEENDLRDNPGLGLEMHLADEDEVTFCDDDEREGIEYTIENFELPITLLSSAQAAPAAEEQRGQQLAGVGNETGPDPDDDEDDAIGASSSGWSELLSQIVLEPGTSASSNRTPASHILLPHSFGPSRSGQGGQGALRAGAAAPADERRDGSDAPDLAYVDAALLHAQHRHPRGSSSSNCPSSSSFSSSSGPSASSSRRTMTIETIHPGTLHADETRKEAAAPPTLAARLASFVSGAWGGGAAQQ